MNDDTTNEVKNFRFRVHVQDQKEKHRMNDDTTNEVKNFRFRVHVQDQVGGTRKLGVMSVRGLSTASAGRIALKRAVVRDDLYLLEWWLAQDSRDIRITVVDVAADAMTFILHGATVEDIEWSDLDAGANQLFTETAYVKYEGCETPLT